MSVSKRKLKKGVRWRYDKTIRGHRIHSPYIYTRKKTAEEAEAEAVHTYLKTGQVPIRSETPSAGETVADLYTAWLKWLDGHRSPAHAYRMKSLLSRALAQAPEHIDTLAAKLTVEEVEEWAERWVDDLVENGKTAHTVNDWLRYSQTAYNKPWGRRRAMREYSFNPFKYVDRYSVSKTAKYVPSPAHVKALRLASEGEFRLYFEALEETGARPNEALSLAWIDVSCDAQPYSLVLYTKKTATGDRTPRRLEISTGLAEMFRSWRRRQRKAVGVHIFRQADQDQPHHLVWARKNLKAAAKRAEVPPFPPSSMRHYYASRLAQEGIPLTTIQARLGHTQATTTNNYLRELVGV